MNRIDSVRILFENGSSATVDYDGDVTFDNADCFFTRKMIDEVDATIEAVKVFNEEPAA